MTPVAGVFMPVALSTYPVEAKAMHSNTCRLFASTYVEGSLGSEKARLLSNVLTRNKPDIRGLAPALESSRGAVNGILHVTDSRQLGTVFDMKESAIDAPVGSALRRAWAYRAGSERDASPSPQGSAQAAEIPACTMFSLLRFC